MATMLSHAVFGCLLMVAGFSAGFVLCALFRVGSGRA
jgi:hypothetical protein